MTKGEVAYILTVLKKTRGLVVDAAVVGFNYKEGNWAIDFYTNNGALTNAIKTLEKELGE